ncbi:MAG: hypothetical protein ABI625_15630 [bacterium]
MSRFASRLLASASFMFVASSAASAQAAQPAPTHPVVCAKGVRMFTEKSQIPVPYDTVRVPRPSGPVIVSNPQEAEAAELALRERAGSVGATGVLVTDEMSDDGSGGQRMRRTVTGVYVPADAARAQLACKS